MATTFNFDDVLPALLPSDPSDDKSFYITIGCGSLSAFHHGDTQYPYTGRQHPIDLQHNIRDSDDLLALRDAVEDLRGKIQEKLDELEMA